MRKQRNIILTNSRTKQNALLKLISDGSKTKGILTLNFDFFGNMELALSSPTFQFVEITKQISTFEFFGDVGDEIHVILFQDEIPFMSSSSSPNSNGLSMLDNEYKKRKRPQNSDNLDDDKKRFEDKHEEENEDDIEDEFKVELNDDVQQFDAKDSAPAKKCAKKSSHEKASAENCHSQAKISGVNPNSESENEAEETVDTEISILETSKKQHKDALDFVESAKKKEPTFALDEGIEYNGENFYAAVKPQLEEMFECYPDEKVLNDLIANSRWVKIENEDEFYVVGVISSEQGTPEFICYGIPSTHDNTPPSEISDVCDWFPVDKEVPYGDGYWLIYQSAITGKCLTK